MNLIKRRLDSGKAGQKAFSLLESMIAIGIIGFIGLVILNAIDTNTKTTGIIDERITATNLATECIEVIRISDFDITVIEITENITVPDFFDVNIDIECSTDGENFTSCVGGETLKRFSITVLHGEKPVFNMCTFKSDF